MIYASSKNEANVCMNSQLSLSSHSFSGGGSANDVLGNHNPSNLLSPPPSFPPQKGRGM